MSSASSPVASPAGGAPPPPPPDVGKLRTLALFGGAGGVPGEAPDAALRAIEQHLHAGTARWLTLARDTLIDVPDDLTPAVCLVIRGQVSLGVFDLASLQARGPQQRDAAQGEKGEKGEKTTLMPPGPLARTSKHNLAMFGAGEAFNLGALPPTDDDRIAAFTLGGVEVLLLGTAAMAAIAQTAPMVERALGATIAATTARLRSVTGVKREILDFYIRNGISVAGPTVRVRQLDLCIDCKQCEDACEDRHGAQRLTLGGYELGLLDFVYTCRTCEDARCLSPCEHDAIKRDAKTGEIKIVEDRCIGCSLCALSCPYGAINMINVAEPEMPSFQPSFKARLEKGHKLAFGPGKGRKALARRIANKCDHCAGYADQACVSACPTGSLIEIAPAVLFQERGEPEQVSRKRKRLRVLPAQPFLERLGVHDSGEARVRTRKLGRLLWVLGLGSFLAVFAEVLLRWFQPTMSVSYRLLLLDGLSPDLAAMNVSFLAGTKLAVTCGYLGTALMVLSMAYVLQRRFGWFHKTATNQFWLDVHLMTGFVGPLFIVLHSAMRLTTWVSIPFWSMVVVVVSGIIGRYLYTLVPLLTSRHDLEILDHRRTITELAASYPVAGDYAYQLMEREAARSERSWEIGLVPLLVWVMFDDLRRVWTRGRDRRALKRLAPRKIANEIARRIDRVVFFERRKELAPRSKAMLKSWKRVHIPFSVVLLVTMILHIVIALGMA
ncbi:MAG: 4Fe-4S binding protein [Proteobacteria bacterium]|nr:4Fe-4S binding protein [Pseudomonadota bacterium]